jgi:hypothetical protein
MAGDWLKFEASTPDKPEVFAITTAMGWDDPDLTVGKLLRVWRWFDQQTIDGNAPSVTLALLDRISGVTGFSKAMCDVRWLIETEAGLCLPRFERHNGKTAKDRAQSAKRQAQHKAKSDGNGETNADSVSGALPREEKRREELKPTTPDGVVAASGAGKPEKPDCPHQEIIALYHEVLPQCPQVRDWTPARATQLRARWNEDDRRQNLGYWRKFFEYVAQCDFLVGKAHSSVKRPFFADLEWLVKSANFTKIREGKYDNG